MKTIYLSIISLFTCFTLMAGNGAYEKAMQKNLEAMAHAQDKQAMLEAANGFERIANNEPEEWLPLYYAALTYINMSFFETGVEAKDAALNKASSFIDRASFIAPEESEIVLLEGYQTMMLLSADPGNRGQSLSPKVMQLFGKAMQMNPENPRAYYLMAQMEFGTAQFFGNGTEKACALVNKSLELFGKGTSENTISPSWGEENANKLGQECSSEQKQ